MIQSPFTPAWHELGSDASDLEVTRSYPQSVRDHYLYLTHLTHYSAVHIVLFVSTHGRPWALAYKKKQV